jgi:hypothetical protein
MSFVDCLTLQYNDKANNSLSKHAVAAGSPQTSTAKAVLALVLTLTTCCCICHYYYYDNYCSDLYQLDSEDWRSRPAVRYAQPVMSTANTINTEFGSASDTKSSLKASAVYKGKWVAEVVLAREVGHEVNAYRGKRATVLQLKRSRARAKMYNRGTALHKGDGENTRLFSKVIVL